MGPGWPETTGIGSLVVDTQQPVTGCYWLLSSVATQHKGRGGAPAGALGLLVARNAWVIGCAELVVGLR